MLREPNFDKLLGLTPPVSLASPLLSEGGSCEAGLLIQNSWGASMRPNSPTLDDILRLPPRSYPGNMTVDEYCDDLDVVINQKTSVYNEEVAKCDAERKHEQFRQSEWQENQDYNVELRDKFLEDISCDKIEKFVSSHFVFLEEISNGTVFSERHQSFFKPPSSQHAQLRLDYSHILTQELGKHSEWKGGGGGGALIGKIPQ